MVSHTHSNCVQENSIGKPSRLSAVLALLRILCFTVNPLYYTHHGDGPDSVFVVLSPRLILQRRESAYSTSFASLSPPRHSISVFNFYLFLNRCLVMFSFPSIAFVYHVLSGLRWGKRDGHSVSKGTVYMKRGSNPIRGPYIVRVAEETRLTASFLLNLRRLVGSAVSVIRVPGPWVLDLIGLPPCH
jgi:hypothetical protein